MMSSVHLLSALLASLLFTSSSCVPTGELMSDDDVQNIDDVYTRLFEEIQKDDVARLVFRQSKSELFVLNPKGAVSEPEATDDVDYKAEMAAAAGVEEVDMAEVETTEEEEPMDGCRCQNLACVCCVNVMTVDSDEVPTNAAVCVAGQLTHNVGILVSVTWNGQVIYRKEISASNPPPLCFKPAVSKKLGSICVQFYNLRVSPRSFKGCVRLLVKFILIPVQKIELGCFGSSVARLDNPFTKMTYIQNSAQKQKL